MDLPFSLTFYRWLLSEEHTITLEDLVHVNPDLYRYFSKLQDVVRKKEMLERDQNLRPSERLQLIDQLDLDGCRIADLGLYFQLPGYSNVELKKGGSDSCVTIHNLDQYIKVILIK